MKKKGYIYGGIFCLITLVGASLFYFKKEPVPQVNHFGMTTRVFPKVLDIPAYLSGNFARQKGKLDKTLEYYLKSLEKDPENLRLLQDTYTLVMIQGKTKEILSYLPQLKKINPPPSLLSYLLISEEIKLGNMKRALEQLSRPNQAPVHPFISPLLRSWIYIKLGQKEKALSTLNELDKTPAFHFAKAYQTFLIGSYLNDLDLQQKSVKEMKEKRLPAIGYFLLLKKQIESQQKWEESDLYQQFEKMKKNYPATAELILYFSETDLTWDKGLAEIFYFVSADAANSLLTKEEALILNSIALYLFPQKQLALVWASELNENLNFPNISLNYYEKLEKTNATLLFKKALLLQQANRSEEALLILKNLYPKNKDNIPLLLQMGQIYLQSNNFSEALKYYTQILNQSDGKLENKELAKIYAVRANIYYQLNQYDLMMADLEKGHILAPDDAMIQNDLGYNLLIKNKIDEGFSLIQQAYQEHPQDPYILDSLAIAYHLKNQNKVALPFAEKALTKMPQSALIHLHLGEIYEALNRKREAQFQYKKAQDLKSDLNPEIEKKLKEKLKI